MKSTVRLFKIKGIQVGLSWTWIFVLLLVSWSLGSVMFPATYPGLSGATYLVTGLIATVLFFASILVHELSHAHVRGGVS
jgi:Zn-dependent protease